jgi:hypothetical protein
VTCIAFAIAYLVVGVPVYFGHGAVSKNVFATLAGLLSGIAYITLVVGFSSAIHSASH